MSGRTGGCLCGTVRYQAEGTPIWVAHCHCKSCRKASGAPIVTWAGYQRVTVTWVAKPFAYSPHVLRCFCPDCDTPVSYESTRWPDELHIPDATLDDPEGGTPTAHVYWSEHLAWLEIGDDTLKKLTTTGTARKKEH